MLYIFLHVIISLYKKIITTKLFESYFRYLKDEIELIWLIVLNNNLVPYILLF